MKTEYDEIFLDYWEVPNGNYIMKMKKDYGLADIKNTLPAHLGAFILSSSKRKMNIFKRQKTDCTMIAYTRDSLYIETIYWCVFGKANLVGEDLCQGKKDYKTRDIFYGLRLATIMKHCLTINDFYVIKKNTKLLKDSKIKNGF